MKERVQKSLVWALILSETTHVFCCVLPTLFSVLSLIVGMGMMASMPDSMVRMHTMIHAWEVPIIIFSGVVLALGWGISWYSDRLDCHDTGCHHGACAPQKNKAHLVLVIATVLFTFNLAMYLFVHRSPLVVNKLMHHNEQPHTHNAQ